MRTGGLLYIFANRYLNRRILLALRWNDFMPVVARPRPGCTRAAVRVRTGRPKTRKKPGRLFCVRQALFGPATPFGEKRVQRHTTVTDEIWRLRRVLAAIGMSRSWLYEEVDEGRFPAPLQLGQRAIGWRRSDIQAWLETRVRKVDRNDRGFGG